MDIREYNIKKLPYHFVLFYNLPADKLLTFRSLYQGQENDNALLTYCYLDQQCGLSYRAICWATVFEDNSIKYHHDREMTTMLILREGGLNSDALVFEESDMLFYKHHADHIKEAYGYMPDNTEIHEEVLFDDFRHPSYPNDILVVFLSPDQKVEKMWVTELGKAEDGAIMVKLLNEPMNPLMGVHEGDLVRVIPYDIGDGKQTPVAVLDWMK